MIGDVDELTAPRMTPSTNLAPLLVTIAPIMRFTAGEVEVPMSLPLKYELGWIERLDVPYSQQARSETAPGERAYGGPDSIAGGRRTCVAARNLGVATLYGPVAAGPLEVPYQTEISLSPVSAQKTTSARRFP
jgi:hypothetical protein